MSPANSKSLAANAAASTILRMIKDRPHRLDLIYINQPLYFVTFTTRNRRAIPSLDDAQLAIQRHARYGINKFNVALGRYEEAVDPLKKSVEIKPQFVFGHDDLGIVYSVLGQHPEALDEFKRVVELEPRHVDANLRVGLEYLSLGNKQAAMQQYYILKEFAPEAAQQLYSLLYR